MFCVDEAVGNRCRPVCLPGSGFSAREDPALPQHGAVEAMEAEARQGLRHRCRRDQPI